MDKRSRILLGIFAVIWIIAIVPNHLTFRTYALDLGLYTHVAFDYAHGHMDNGSMFLERPMPILADHFDIHLLFWAPLTFLFGTWTLLLVQWISIVLGAIGIHRLVASLYSSNAALLALVIFCTTWGIYSALAFDFHSSVVASMAVPWLLYLLVRNRDRAAWLVLLFILLAKENMGFWMFLLLPGSFLLFKQLGRTRKVMLWMSVFGLIYSLLISAVVMPALTPSGAYAHFNYSSVGEGLGDLLGTVASAPQELIFAFVQHPISGAVEYIKVETFIIFILAGGWACLINPRFLLMVLPIFVFKMWNDQDVLWSLNGHYSIEFVPIIAWAVAHHREAYHQNAWLSSLVIGMSIACTIHVIDGTRLYQERGRSRFYQARHFERPWGLDDSWKALSMIPDSAPVSAQSPYVPHLALRKDIYQYPIVNNAQYIILNQKEQTYPLDTNVFRLHVLNLRNSELWKPIFISETALLFERVSEQPVNSQR